MKSSDAPRLMRWTADKTTIKIRQLAKVSKAPDMGRAANKGIEATVSHSAFSNDEKIKYKIANPVQTKIAWRGIKPILAKITVIISRAKIIFN